MGIQIRQDAELTRVQIFSDATHARIQMHESMLGDDPAPIVMKSLTRPEALSLDELLVKVAYLLTAVNEARLRLVLAQEGLRVDSAEEENILSLYFGNRFAQSWWNQFIADGKKMTSDINRELDRIIRSAADTNLTLSFFRELGEQLNIRSTASIPPTGRQLRAAMVRFSVKRLNQADCPGPPQYPRIGRAASMNGDQAERTSTTF